MAKLTAVHRLESIDRNIASVMEKHGMWVLRWSVAIIFVWFGALKWFDLSPANELVTRTVYWIRPQIFIPILATWEVLIGICLLFRPLLRLAILLLAAQMIGTFLPLVLLPEICFTRVPYAPTLEGQYILKNLVIIAAAMVVGGTVRKSSTAFQRL